METGIGYYPSHNGLSPDVVAEIVEQRGHTSLFFADHSHIPSDLASSPNGQKMSRSAQRIWHMHDLFVAMTAAVSATSRLRVGSGICLVVQRDPIITAKAVASLDVLSGGRIEFGVGAGWNREEMQNHGTDPRTRMALLRERVEAITTIWAEDVATYHGEFVNFDRIWSWPKPVQGPRPPVLVAGNGPTVIDRVLTFGDGWFPNRAHNDLPRIAELQRRAAEMGRRVSVYNMDTPSDPHVLEQLAEAGVKQVVHWIPAAGRGPIERELDEFENAIAAFTGG